VNLLTRAPQSYYAWLVENGAAPRLVHLLEVLLVLYLVEEDPGAQDPGRQVAPCLDAVRRMAGACRAGFDAVRALVFPPAADAAWRARVAADRARARGDAAAQEAFAAARTCPADAPKYTLRSLLFQILTDADEATRRLAAELVYDLCGRDAAEFALRAGLGNVAAHLQTVAARRGGEAHGPW